jgi:hypothetical protein
MILVDMRRLGKVIAYDSGVASKLGSITAAILLRHLVYCGSPTEDGYIPLRPDEHGWMDVTIEKLGIALAMGEKQLNGAREDLEALGLIETVRRGIPARLFWRVMDDAVQQFLAGPHQDQIRQKGGTRTDETGEQAPPKGRNLIGQKGGAGSAKREEHSSSQSLEETKKIQRAEPGVNSVAVKAVRERAAAVQARNLFAEEKPPTVPALLAMVWQERGDGTQTLEAVWARAYPELWAQSPRRQTALDIAHNYMMTSDANWAWPRSAVPKIEAILQKHEDDARRIAVVDARANAQQVKTAVEVSSQPAPADQAERDAFNRCYPRDGFAPPRSIQIWRDAGRPASWPPEQSDAPVETTQRVSHDPTLRPQMTSEQEATARAALENLAGRFKPAEKTQQRAPQAAEKAIPQETEEAKAARRAKAIELVAEAKRKERGEA